MLCVCDCGVYVHACVRVRVNSVGHSTRPARHSNLTGWVCVCVCMCLFVSEEAMERDRDRQRESERAPHGIVAGQITATGRGKWAHLSPEYTLRVHIMMTMTVTKKIKGEW